MEKLWYVVNTYSGHEESVKEKLLMRAESMGFQDYIFRVIVPETTEIEVKDGIKKEKKKKIDHVLVNMGLSRMDIESEMAIGDKVAIVDGPFKGMNGTVNNIDLENNRLNVMIDLFGQETSVEVELFQVNKL